MRLRRFRRSDKPFQELDIDIVKLIRYVISLVREKIDKSKIKILFNETQLPVIKGDKNYLRHAFLNIFLNAIEAIGNKRGGQISIFFQLNKKKDRITINVEDNGFGIKEDNKNLSLIHI